MGAKKTDRERETPTTLLSHEYHLICLSLWTLVSLYTSCFFLFYAFCVFVHLYRDHLVVKAASIDRYSCLSGSLPLLFF